MNKLHNIVALSLIATVLTAPTWILAQGESPSPTNTPNVISINFVRSSGDTTVIPSDSITGLTPADKWNNSNGTSTGTDLPLVLSSDSDEATDISLTYNAPATWSWTGNVTDLYLKNFLGDSTTGAQITVKNIPFPLYDVIIYQATDSASQKFSPPAVNGKYYTWDSTNNMTILSTTQTSNANANQYGITQKMVAKLGDNALHIENLATKTLTIAGAPKNDTAGYVARGQIAAIQIIKRSPVKNVTLNANTNWSAISSWTSSDLPTEWVNDGTYSAHIQVNGSITLTVDSVGTPASPVDARSIAFSSDEPASVMVAGVFSTEVINPVGLKGSLTIPANADIGELRYQADPTQKVVVDVAGIDFSEPITTILRAKNLQFTRLEILGVLPENATLRVVEEELQVFNPTPMDVTFDVPMDWDETKVPTTAMADAPITLAEYIDNENAHQTVGGRDVIAVHVAGGDTREVGVYGLHRINSRGLSQLDKDVYLKISGGTHGTVTAGQEANWTNSNRKTDLTGNQFTEIIGNAEVNHVLGAGDKAGEGPTITGNTAVVISGDAIVWGNIVGGWTSAHNQTGTVTGNTSIKITKVLGFATLALDSLSAGWIIGGGAWTYNSVSSSQVSGNTNVTIDLPTSATGNFARKIVGGAYTNDGTHSVNGSSTVTITAPNTVTFNDEIYGGGYRQSGTLNNKGVATVSLNGGTYTSIITAGSRNGNGITGPAELSIAGGVFDGAILTPGSATGDKTLTFSGTPTFTGASNIQAGFTSASVVEGGTLALGGTTQVNLPITGAVTITDGTVTAPDTEIFVDATVSFEPNAKLSISITEGQKLALTTTGSIISTKLFKVTSGADAGIVGTYVQLKYAEEEALTGLAFFIVDDVLYVANTETDTILLAPFATAITESADWTLASWQDANGTNVTTEAWNTVVPSANITVPINQVAILSIDQPITIGTLNLLTPAEATHASVFTLALKASTSGALTSTIIDASTTTQSITLDLPTGVAEVRAGVDTTLMQAGTGSLIIGAGKKATLSGTDRTTITNNGTLVYEGVQTDVTPGNTGNVIEIDTTMSFGAYTLNTNHLKVKSGGDVTITGRLRLNLHKDLSIDGGKLTVTSVDSGGDYSESQMIITNGGQLIVNGNCNIAWYNPAVISKWEISGEASLLKANGITTGNTYAARLPNVIVKDNAVLSIGASGVHGDDAHGVTNFYYDGGILTAHANWTLHRKAPTYITKGSSMTIDPASHVITYNMPITDEAVGDVGGGTLVIGRAGTTGTVTLTVANTYTSGTTLNAGTLEVAHAQALGTGTFTVARGSTLKLTGLTGSVEAPALAIAAVIGTTGVVNVTHPLTEAQLAGDPIKLITIPEGVTVDDFAWTFVDGETVIDPSTYSLTFDEATRTVSIDAVIVTITDGVSVSDSVRGYILEMAKANTQPTTTGITEVRISSSDANKAYLLNVIPGFGRNGTTNSISEATLNCSFLVSDLQIVGATITATATINVVDPTRKGEGNINGALELLSGTELDTIETLVTTTPTDDPLTLMASFDGTQSFYKMRVVEKTSETSDVQ